MLAKQLAGHQLHRRHGRQQHLDEAARFLFDGRGQHGLPAGQDPDEHQQAERHRQHRREAAGGLTLGSLADGHRWRTRDLHDRLEGGTVERLRTDARADDRFAQVVVDHIDRAFVQPRGDVEIVGAVPGLAGPERRGVSVEDNECEMSRVTFAAGTRVEPGLFLLDIRVARAFDDGHVRCQTECMLDGRGSAARSQALQAFRRVGPETLGVLGASSHDEGRIERGTNVREQGARTVDHSHVTDNLKVPIAEQDRRLAATCDARRRPGVRSCSV